MEHKETIKNYSEGKATKLFTLSIKKEREKHLLLVTLTSCQTKWLRKTDGVQEPFQLHHLLSVYVGGEIVGSKHLITNKKAYHCCLGFSEIEESSIVRIVIE